MKKFRLEVIVEDKDARETLTFLQKLIINNIGYYELRMEEYNGQG
jgi:hypothetical protein